MINKEHYFKAVALAVENMLLLNEKNELKEDMASISECLRIVANMVDDYESENPRATREDIIGWVLDTLREEDDGEEDDV